MRTTLLAFHGYTLNGERMRAQMTDLASALGPHVELAYPDAPHAADPAGVDRLYAVWSAPRPPPPHLTWWDATEDGSSYRGWERTRDEVHGWIERASPVGVLGFSQGAILAATVAALSSAGEFPPIRFAVLVAGRTPRATSLQALFEHPIRVPSLHVWGDKDLLTAPEALALVERFDPTTREVVRWPGPHSIPAKDPAATAIVDFVRRRDGVSRNEVLAAPVWWRSPCAFIPDSGQSRLSRSPAGAASCRIPCYPTPPKTTAWTTSFSPRERMSSKSTPLGTSAWTPAASARRAAARPASISRPTRAIAAAAGTSAPSASVSGARARADVPRVSLAARAAVSISART